MIADIQNEFDFNFPALYVKIEQDGNLNWGTQGPNWYKEIYPLLRENPPFLLFCNDFKILDEEQIRKLIHQFRADWDKLGLFVPFGKNGAGDYISFRFNENKEIDCICKLSRKTEFGYVLARNFEDFLFRELLLATYDINESDIEEGEEDFLQDLQAMLNSHKKYLPKRQFDILQKIYYLPINQYEDEQFGMIDSNEFDALLESEVTNDLMPKEFTYRIL